MILVQVNGVSKDVVKGPTVLIVSTLADHGGSGDTVEGNSGDKCCQRSYPVGYYEIYGYGQLHP